MACGAEQMRARRAGGCAHSVHTAKAHSVHTAAHTVCTQRKHRRVTRGDGMRSADRVSADRKSADIE
eukprot:3100763-Rhodomonas_salina.1